VARLRQPVAGFAAALAAGALALLGGASAARADYTVNFCAGNPAPVWTQGFHASDVFIGDSCAFIYSSTTIPFNHQPGEGFQMPSGLSITHYDLGFTYEAQSSGSDPFLTFGVTTVPNGTPTDVDNEWEMSKGAGAPVSVSTDVPGGGVQFWGNVFCSTDASTNCNFASAQVVTINNLSLTVHDATIPAAAATGGSLAAAGTYAGTQPLIYTATSAGSGVAKVTLSLGSTVVGTATPTCKVAQLQPCPASATGQFNVDTTQVPDGTYPVILTAYDASGDATPVQVATVGIDNQSSTVGPPVPTASTGKKSSRRHRVDVHAKLYWHFIDRRTEFAKIRFDHALPRNTRISLVCTGRGCPVHRLAAGRRSVDLFLAALHGRQFRPGDKVTLSFSRPHRLPERVQLTMRAHRKPRLKVLAAR
jgi:hypothetical protein